MKHEPAMVDSRPNQAITRAAAIHQTWTDVERAQKIELRFLIRRFEIQLRYGCADKDCRSWHCLTGRKHLSTGPSRRPSPLTARMMAFQLASQSDPHGKLCSNRPPVLPQQLELSSVILEQEGRSSASQIPAQLVRRVYRPVDGQPEQVEQDSGPLPNSRTIKDYWQQNLQPPQEKQLDRKSLAQNLFSTKAIRSFLWSPLASEPDLPVLRNVLGLRKDAAVSTVQLSLKNSPVTDVSLSEPSKLSSKLSQFSKMSLENLHSLKKRYKEAVALRDMVVVDDIKNILSKALGTAQQLLASFPIPIDPGDPSIDHLIDTFNWSDMKNGTMILRFFSNAIDGLFIPPADWELQSNPSRHAESLAYIEDADAAHLIFLCWLVLLVWTCKSPSGGQSRNAVEADELKLMIRAGSTHSRSDRVVEMCTEIVNGYDAFHCEAAMALATKVVHAMGVRTAFTEARTDLSTADRRQICIHRQILKKIVTLYSYDDNFSVGSAISAYECWMVMVINHNWNGQAVVNRWDAVGAALEFFSLDAMFPQFSTNVKLTWVEARLPAYQEDNLLGYMDKYGKDPNRLYLWNMPDVFSSTRSLRSFRALNYARMSSAYKEAVYAEQLSERLQPGPPVALQQFMKQKLEKATSRYLVLNVRREQFLEDALDQLWGREQRELLRPLKVKMGMDLGEAGVDQGGVSQEFFRLVYHKAFDPEFGLFAPTYENSPFLWPRANCVEPLVTYQLLGLLTALGLYNGFTLPISFPLVFYILLCKGSFSFMASNTVGEDLFTIDNIKDAWPSMSKNLEDVERYDADKLEDDLALDWTYTFVSDGANKHVDMFAAMDDDELGTRRCHVPASPEQSTPVTASNRVAYIREYIRWSIKETVHDQLEAFAHGFKAVVNDAALSMLTPETLMKLAEGEKTIDITALESVTQLEGGYTWDDDIISWFWAIVREYPPAQHRALLNFVTAIDRVPASGMDSISFAIVKAGPDSELLPSSSTCFGKLLIPEYASKEKLKAKLQLALENSVGFGTA